MKKILYLSMIAAMGITTYVNAKIDARSPVLGLRHIETKSPSKNDDGEIEQKDLQGVLRKNPKLPRYQERLRQAYPDEPSSQKDTKKEPLSPDIESGVDTRSVDLGLKHVETKSKKNEGVEQHDFRGILRKDQVPQVPRYQQNQYRLQQIGKPRKG